MVKIVWIDELVLLVQLVKQRSPYLPSIPLISALGIMRYAV
jgi:hypothetical protein